MKCYNCDHHLEDINNLVCCPKCKHKIRKKEYQIDTTKVILDQIKTKSDFARLIGLFNINPIILIVLAILSLAGTSYYLFNSTSVRIEYFVFAVLFLFMLVLLFQQNKITKLYNDFKKNNNHYYILYPFKATNRVIANELTDKIVTTDILKQRFSCFENYGERYYSLHFNTYKLFHPQKLKLVLTKEKFYHKYFGDDIKHVLQTYNELDDSFVLIEGVVHGFLVLDNHVITIFNTPGITKKYLQEVFVGEH